MDNEYPLAPHCVAVQQHFSAERPEPQLWGQVRDKLASLPFHEIPPTLDLPCPYGPFELLWCCWVVGADQLFDFFGNPRPDQIEHSALDNSGCTKLTVSQLPKVLETALLLPQEVAEKMNVIEVLNSEGMPELAFAVGSNYQGIMPVDFIELVSWFFFDGKHPTWALNAPHTAKARILPLREEQRNNMQVVDTREKSP